ncbi:hypothetical protein D3C73_983170 [compost metagenome]
MRVEQVIILFIILPDRIETLLVLHTQRGKISLHLLQRFSGDSNLPFGLQLGHIGRELLRIPAHQVIEVPFKVAGHLNIHRRAVGAREASRLIFTSVHEPFQDIVFIRGDN